MKKTLIFIVLYATFTPTNNYCANKQLFLKNGIFRNTSIKCGNGSVLVFINLSGKHPIKITDGTVKMYAEECSDFNGTIECNGHLIIYTNTNPTNFTQTGTGTIEIQPASEEIKNELTEIQRNHRLEVLSSSSS